MRKNKVAHEDLISWLKYFDIEYLNDAECDRLSVLDINDKAQMREALALAVMPEFEALNPTSKKSMLAVLENALSANEQELQPVFDRVAMPFPYVIASKHEFLDTLSEMVCERQV